MKHEAWEVYSMKILGRIGYEADRFDNVHPAGGAYIAVNAQSAYVESYNGKSIDKCDKFFVVVYAGNFRYDIRYSEDEYFSVEEANKIVKGLVKNDYIDLDEYGLYFTSVYRFTSIEVSNCCYEDEYDEEVTPLRVTIVADETKID